jgi:hypothetical protein
MGSVIPLRLASTSTIQLTNATSRFTSNNNISSGVRRVCPFDIQSSTTNIFMCTLLVDVAFQNTIVSILIHDIDTYMINRVAHIVLISISILTLLSFVAHIVFSFRYRYSWHRLSTGVTYSCTCRCSRFNLCVNCSIDRSLSCVSSTLSLSSPFLLLFPWVIKNIASNSNIAFLSSVGKINWENT